MMKEVIIMDIIKTNIDSYIEDVLDFNIIEFSDIPNIDLYMDQVTTFMQDNYESIKRFPDDKVLTKTMINNYAKARLFPAPIKKKYTKNHIMLLILIYHLKFLLSINDINKLLKPITADLKVNEHSPILESIYNNFVLLQKKIKNNLSYSLDDALNDQDLVEFKGNVKIDMKYMVTILYFSIQANANRRIAEKILDNNF